MKDFLDDNTIWRNLAQLKLLNKKMVSINFNPIDNNVVSNEEENRNVFVAVGYVSLFFLPHKYYIYYIYLYIYIIGYAMHYVTGFKVIL